MVESPAETNISYILANDAGALNRHIKLAETHHDSLPLLASSLVTRLQLQQP